MSRPTTFRGVELLINSINLSQNQITLELKRDIHSFPYTVYVYKTLGSHARHFDDLQHVNEYVMGIKDTLDSLAQNKGGL